MLRNSFIKNNQFFLQNIKFISLLFILTIKWTIQLQQIFLIVMGILLFHETDIKKVNLNIRQ